MTVPCTMMSYFCDKCGASLMIDANELHTSRQEGDPVWCANCLRLAINADEELQRFCDSSPAPPASQVNTSDRALRGKLSGILRVLAPGWAAQAEQAENALSVVLATKDELQSAKSMERLNKKTEQARKVVPWGTKKYY